MSDFQHTDTSTLSLEDLRRKYQILEWFLKESQKEHVSMLQHKDKVISDQEQNVQRLEKALDAAKERIEAMIDDDYDKDFEEEHDAVVGPLEFKNTDDLSFLQLQRSHVELEARLHSVRADLHFEEVRKERYRRERRESRLEKHELGEEKRVLKRKKRDLEEEVRSLKSRLDDQAFPEGKKLAKEIRELQDDLEDECDKSRSYRDQVAELKEHRRQDALKLGQAKVTLERLEAEVASLQKAKRESDDLTAH